MLNHGLQMNDLQTEFPAYPKVLLLTVKIEEVKNIRYSISMEVITSIENQTHYIIFP